MQALHRSAGAMLSVLLISGALGCSRGEPEALPQADPAARRTLPAGELIGYATEDGAHAFLGLPFAQPPVGELRWRAPRPAAAWSGVREALAFGDGCVQFAGPMSSGEGPSSGSEDCLYLNVFAPRFEPGDVPQDDERLPVMVWIHGGGNTLGDAKVYEGSVLAERERLIVVTVQYRLGVMGWFSHPALHDASDSAEDRSGNYGTLDLVQALRWVQDNVSGFGGDPQRVTVFGESAGGSDTYTLLLSPLARGLFQRAIVQSGGLSTNSMVEAQAPHDAPEPGHERSSAEVLRSLLAADERDDAMALGGAEVREFLRTRTPDELLSAYSGDGMGGMYRMPMLLRDGYVLPADEPLEVFARGDYNQVPVIVGSNRDETKLFAAFGSPHVRHLFGIPIGMKNGIQYAATTKYGTMMWKASAVDEPATAMSAVQGQSVFGYRFDWDDLPDLLWLDMAELIGAAHALEIPFVFGRLRLGRATPIVFDDDRRESDERLSHAMMSYWARHAYLGSPGRGRNGDLPEWRAWSEPRNASGGFLVLDSDSDAGIRMSADVLTQAAVVDAVKSDTDLPDAAQRCEIYAQFVERSDALSPEGYEAIEDGACKDLPLS